MPETINISLDAITKIQSGITAIHGLLDVAGGSLTGGEYGGLDAMNLGIVLEVIQDKTDEINTELEKLVHEGIREQLI